jgi:hypothetical protein
MRDEGFKKLMLFRGGVAIAAAKFIHNVGAVCAGAHGDIYGTRYRGCDGLPMRSPGTDCKTRERFAFL